LLDILGEAYDNKKLKRAIKKFVKSSKNLLKTLDKLK
jgi:hypothetical protein